MAIFFCAYILRQSLNDDVITALIGDGEGGVTPSPRLVKFIKMVKLLEDKNIARVKSIIAAVGGSIRILPQPDFKMRHKNHLGGIILAGKRRVKCDDRRRRRQ